MRNQDQYCESNSCYPFFSDGKDFYVNRNDCDIQVDITERKEKRIIIWGNVCDCCGQPIAHALIKLFRYERDCKNKLRGICHTFTDCNGYYQFDLPGNSHGKYRVVASKSSCGSERCQKTFDSCECFEPLDDTCTSENAYYNNCNTNKNKVSYY